MIRCSNILSLPVLLAFQTAITVLVLFGITLVFWFLFVVPMMRKHDSLRFVKEWWR